jgi:hypothetical protein
LVNFGHALRLLRSVWLQQVQLYIVGQGRVVLAWRLASLSPDSNHLEKDRS